MRTIELHRGRWYVAITCSHCRYQIVLFQDFTKGETDFTKATVKFFCPKCKQVFMSSKALSV